MDAAKRCPRLGQERSAAERPAGVSSPVSRRKEERFRPGKQRGGHAAVLALELRHAAAAWRREHEVIHRGKRRGLWLVAGALITTSAGAAAAACGITPSRLLLLLLLLLQLHVLQLLKHLQQLLVVVQPWLQLLAG